MPERIAIFSHELGHHHDTGPGHPESPARHKAAVSALKNSPFAERLDWYECPPVDPKWIESIHTPEYRQFVEEACLSGKHTVDFGETTVSPDSYQAALHAAGGACSAVDAVMENRYLRAFNCMRPPGHHARTEQAMGFCLFNNIAIAAHYAMSRYGLERIGIVDWDVHHGNGTQETFYYSPTVLFFSIHQLPLYPHTGEFYDSGAKGGQGFTVNSPIHKGAQIHDYLEAFNSDLKPALDTYKPQLILISAGFDSHELDPLADIRLKSTDYYTLTEWVCQQAGKHCDSKIVSLLEGGYNLDALGESVSQHVRALLEVP